jgi:type IV pilus assembly protein PilX
MRQVIEQVRARQHGMALISSLLLLVVVTILALSMFRSFGVEEKIAGNVREKQRALHSAESAQEYAEWWLTQPGNVVPATTCTALLSANLNEGQICDAPLVNLNNHQALATVPWPTIGVTINPNNDLSVSQIASTGSYYSTPQFYIYDAGPSLAGLGEVYQIDALGYGATANAVAVVESMFAVSSGIKDLGGL